MEAYALDWVQLLIRWVHLITGIAWIGASFYFVFLDNSLLPPKRQEDIDAGIGGELWAIHGGGFYHAQKFKVAPAALPEPLHWFKWEAYWTWMSGLALFVVMYYAHADIYMIDRGVADLTPWQAIAISLALLAGGWVFYDQLCKRAGLDREKLVAVTMVAFFTAVAWGLSHLFSGRAMFLQIGAMMGTIMAWNVYFVIMPSQRKLVEAKEHNVAPDPVHGLRGKQRSVHNNYFTLPVLFIMISNHYPMTFGYRHAWLVLIAILLLAAFVRHFFNLRHKGRTVWADSRYGRARDGRARGSHRAGRSPKSPSGLSPLPTSSASSPHAARLSCGKAHTAGLQRSHPKASLLDTPALIVANAQKINEQAVLTP
jgi:uncharacterized membrane protein